MQVNQLPVLATPDPNAGGLVPGEVLPIAVPLNFGKDGGVAIEADVLVGDNKAHV
jgi:hypothetical protein